MTALQTLRAASPTWTLLGLVALSGCAHDSAPAPAAAPYAAVARGRVDVEGGLVRVTAALDGRISRVAVQEGQQVHRGDTLVELDDTKARLDVVAAEAALGEASAQIRSLESQLAAAETRATRLRAAADAGVADVQAADDAQAALRQLTAQKDIAAAARAAVEARLASARHAVELHRVTAPQDGQITRRMAQVGGLATASAEGLLELLPQSPLVVRAELGDQRADAVKPGMAALISAEDDPDHGVAAHVLRISPISGPPRYEDDPQRRGSEHTVESVLAFDGKASLRVGQRVLVRIGGKSP